MTRRSAAPVFTFMFGSLLISGCGSETKPVAAPAQNGVDYGDFKMPPPEAVKAVPGRGAGSPGAPLMRR